MSPNAIMLRRQLRTIPRPYRSRWWAHLRSGLMGFIPLPYAKGGFADAVDAAFDRAAKIAVEGH